MAEPEAVEQPEGAPADESAPEGEDAAPEEAPGETEEVDGAGEPPIDPPRSWPKAEKEVFKTLPRETQQKLVDIDKARDREIQKGLQSNAEREKALEAERKAITEARQQYERALPALSQQLQGELAAKFGDIKSPEDAIKLSRENPARFVQWQALVGQAQAAQQEQQRAQEAKRVEAENWFNKFTAEEDAKFLEAAPEFADPKKGDQLRKEAVSALQEVGFTEADITDLWEGRKPALFRDHRFQLLIRDVVRHRMAQRAVKTNQTQPQQSTVRAGIPPARGEAKAKAVQELSQKLSRTGRVDDAVALYRARKAQR